MSSLLVALTTTTALNERRRAQVMLYANYVTALDQVGLVPVLVTPAHSQESVRALMARVGGLVLTGGEDVDPALYGAAPSPHLGEVNPARDAMELAALRCALDAGIAVFGICRGCQVLNVGMGGTLIQDIETEHTQALGHRQEGPWGTRAHRARIETDTRLHDILREPELDINSFHHQAVKDVAPGLRVSAWAGDGLVEAIEATDRAWVLGVQWHPERHEASAPDSDPDRRLFRAFADAVRANASTHAHG